MKLCFLLSCFYVKGSLNLDWKFHFINYSLSYKKNEMGILKHHLEFLSEKIMKFLHFRIQKRTYFNLEITIGIKSKMKNRN